MYDMQKKKKNPQKQESMIIRWKKIKQQKLPVKETRCQIYQKKTLKYYIHFKHVHRTKGTNN